MKIGNIEIPFKDNIYAIYPFGSRIIGNSSDDSDWDYFLILDKKVNQSIVNVNKVSFIIYSKEEFQQKLDEYDPWVIQSYMLPSSQIILNPPTPWKFKLNKDELIKRFVDKMDFCFKKAEKNIREGNLRRGQKNIFYPIHIAFLGFQLLKYDKIVTIGGANKFSDYIYSMTNTNWNDYEIIYKPIYLQLRQWLINKEPKALDNFLTLLPKQQIQSKLRKYEDNR